MAEQWTPKDPWARPEGQAPALAGFETYYGVPVSTIGEDGELVALGHAGKLRALAAFMAYARDAWGDADELFAWQSRPLLPQALDRIEHLWMVNKATPQDWYLARAEQGESDAFPVTWWLA